MTEPSKYMKMAEDAELQRLRDKFAMRMMPAIYTGAEAGCAMREIAKLAYEYADMAMKERAK